METMNLAKNLIERSRNILIFPNSESQGDSYCSALALFYTLKKLGKNANIKIGELPEKFKFLTNHYASPDRASPDRASPDRASPSKDFIISVNTEGKEISQMRYEKNGNDLKIYLKLNNGQLDSQDVSFVPFSSPEIFARDYNLLISVGIQSTENIPQSLWTLPILNIDNHPQNENFGEVNLIDITSSLAEIATDLIKSTAGPDFFNKEISTCLLTGIIWSSQNFRNPKTRPQTFETSAFLIEKEANHQEIIQHLYKQKSISQIKLLGKVLENLNFYEPKEIYSANIKENDFKECGASSKDLAFVFEELKFHFRYLPNLLILWESHASPPITKGIFYSPNQSYIKRVVENFESASKGSGVLFFAKENDLNIVKEKILNIL